MSSPSAKIRPRFIRGQLLRAGDPAEQNGGTKHQPVKDEAESGRRAGLCFPRRLR
jgi:hypothetical protein